MLLRKRKERMKMNMKSILSLILATVLLMLFAVPAFAEDHNITEGGDYGVDVSHTIGNVITSDGEVTSDVTHTVAGGYTLLIPASIAFVKDGKGNVATQQTFGVGNVRIPGETLEVKLSSANYGKVNGKGWVLISARKDSLEYLVKKGGEAVADNGTILSCPNGRINMTEVISFELIDTEPKTVSYTDTLTFTVSVVG